MQSYIKLIKALLSCSQEEEGNLLQQHRDLIDQDLIQGIGILIDQFSKQGQKNSVARLERLSVQLSQIIETENISSSQSVLPTRNLWTILQELDYLHSDVRNMTRRVTLCRQALKFLSRKVNKEI